MYVRTAKCPLIKYYLKFNCFTLLKVKIETKYKPEIITNSNDVIKTNSKTVIEMSAGLGSLSTQKPKTDKQIEIARITNSFVL